MGKNWVSYSELVDSAATGKSGARGHYTIRMSPGIVHATVSVSGYFDKYAFRTIEINDFITIWCDDGYRTYFVTSKNADDSLNLQEMPGAGQSDDQQAFEVPYTSPASGPAAGALQVQAALDALNTTLDGALPQNAASTPATAPVAGPAAGAANAQVYLDALNVYLDDQGTFTGTTISDNVSIHTALQELETALENVSLTVVSADANNNLVTGTDGGAYVDLNAINLDTTAPINGPASGQTNGQGFLDALNSEARFTRSLTGTLSPAVDLGSFAGGTIPDNVTIKSALQSLETALESLPGGHPGASADAGNLIVLGGDGGPFIDQAVIQANETTTSISYDPATQDITYVDEDGGNTVLDLSGLAGGGGGGTVSTDAGNQITLGGDGGFYVNVQARETTTSLTYNQTSKLMAYTDEDGTAIAFDLSSSAQPSIQANNDITTGIDGKLFFQESLTTIAYNAGTQDITYTDEAGNPTVLDLSGLAGGGGSAAPSSDANNDISTGGDGNLFVDVSAQETDITVPALATSGINLTASGTSNHDLGVSVDIVALATAIASNAAAMQQIWGAIVANHMTWDGTELCIDFNNDGNANA